ncbi:ATP-binding response regulator [Dongia deserti]|uniref:ATP-binding response regulator n=1 Tax=Dongia deserti TaxID=2268030 RepID=UPI000E64B29B|nr:ATP-binding protein [Dongia deserti]
MSERAPFVPDEVATAPRSDALLRESVEALGHGFAMWSAEGVLAFCNEAFQNQFPVSGGRLKRGISIRNFLEQVARSGLLMLPYAAETWIADELASTEARRSSEYTFSDGTIHRIERWRLQSGGTLMLSREITTAKKNKLALMKARHDADDAVQNKLRFLRAANHDLRQPLASLKIQIYNCMTCEDEAQRNEILHAMDVSVSIMEDILGALLNIGQLDAGKIVPKIANFQLTTLFERLEVQFAHQAREKGLSFRLVPTTLTVVSDRVLLERIISNFVSNAIRYTETGGVVVGCRRDGKDARLEVWDTGSGFDPKYSQAIFEEFFRIADEQTKHKHSLGLGLNIAKRLADMLHHEIRVRSVPGRGSVFSVKVPVGNIWHSDIGEPEINERIGGEFTGLTVLVLEDDENLREALTTLLQRWGIEVHSFNTFNDVATSFRALEIKPDFIITDYRLRGGVAGTDVVQQVRNCLGTACPAVVVTADTNPSLIKQIRNNGFPVLIKPVSPPSLRVMMHNILYEPELVQELRPPEARD